MCIACTRIPQYIKSRLVHSVYCPERLREAEWLAQGHTAFAVVRICAHYLFPPPVGLYLPSTSPQDPSSPGMATSYSTWKRASWPH